MAEAQQQQHIQRWQQLARTEEAQIQQRRIQLDQAGKNLEQYAEQLHTNDIMLDLAAGLQRPDPQQQHQDIVVFTNEASTIRLPQSTDRRTRPTTCSSN